MKRIASLIMVLALVLCLATAAFAAEPAALVMGTNTATSETDDFVSYTWTAAADGVLTLTFSGEWIFEATDADSNVVASGNSAWSWSPVAQIEVTKDATYTIKVGVLGNPYEGTAVAGTVTFEASFCDGSKEYPYELPAAYYDPTAHSGKWFHVKAAVDAKLMVQFEGVVITDAEGNVLENNFEDEWMGPMLVIELAAGEEFYLNITNVEGAEYSSANFNYVEKGGYDYPYEAALGENVATSSAAAGQAPWFTYYAEESGLLTLTITDFEDGWTYTLWNYANKDSINDPDALSATGYVEAGNYYTFAVAAITDVDGWGEIIDGDVTFELSFTTQGTENDPFFIESEVPTLQTYAGADIYYAFSSRLNGTIVKIAVDEYLTVTVNDEVVEAEGGYVTFTLDSAPVTKVVLTNEGWGDVAYEVYYEYPLGSYNNPISVNVPGDLTSANVAAGAEVWYAVSGRLNGTVLTVEGEGAYVIVNDTRVDAVDGVVTVNLTAEGAVIPVVIGNAGEEDAEFACKIKYPPVEIDAAGTVDVQVSAGAEVEYLVNSRLDGYTLTVEGEDAYVIVDGTKYEAKDGVVSVVLEAKGATISVVVGNAGEATAEYTMTIAYVDVAPPTGDLIAVAVVMMLTSGAALIGLKKKED